MIGELLAVERGIATIPAGIAAATETYFTGRLAYLRQLLALAEAEARELVTKTNTPITDLGRARLALEQAQGYTGAPPLGPDAIAERRAEVERLAGALWPDVEAHRRATEVAGLIRARIEANFGDVLGFTRTDRAMPTLERVAQRAAEAAAERVWRELAAPVGAVA